MSKQFKVFLVLFVAGLALTSLSPGNILELLSRLGISLLAAAIVMGGQFSDKIDRKNLQGLTASMVAFCIGVIILVLIRIYVPH